MLACSMLLSLVHLSNRLSQVKNSTETSKHRITQTKSADQTFYLHMFRCNWLHMQNQFVVAITQCCQLVDRVDFREQCIHTLTIQRDVIKHRPFIQTTFSHTLALDQSYPDKQIYMVPCTQNRCSHVYYAGHIHSAKHM